MKKILKKYLLLIILLLPVITFALEDTAWQSDWTFSKNTTSKTITLSKYNGTSENMKVPQKAVIDDVEYSVVFGTGAGKSSSIKNLSFESGVKVTSLSSMFSDNTIIESIDFRGVDTSSVTTLYYAFKGCTNLKLLNMSGLDLSKATNVRYMFYQATNIEEVDFSNTDMSKITSFAGSNPSNNSNYSSPFYGANNLKKVNFNNFNTASLTNARGMFRIIYRGENQLESLDVTKWNTKNVTNFESAFENSANLETIEGIGTLDTSSATSFWLMFSSCTNLKELPGIGNWDTGKVTNMSSMFSDATNIDNLDLSGWDTSNVTNIGSMFIAAEKLKNINVSTWNTSKVTKMNEVFKGCSSLEVLDLSGWTTDSIENTAHSHMSELFGVTNSMNAGDYEKTPLKEITLNKDFEFKTYVSPGLRSGYWHLKEGTDEETKPKFTPARLYNAYNNGVTPTEGYSHSHTYVLTELDPAEAEYYAQGWGDNNAWEVHYPNDRFKAYCINLHRGSPNGYYDRTKVSGNSIVTEGFLDSDNYGWEPLGSNMEEALITLIYYGYGHDASGIQEKYSLSDSTFLLITQNAIWNFTDRYNNMKVYDGDSDTDKAYQELVSKRFSDIPNKENLKLYLYESYDGKQNLLSISGLSDVAHAGVRVLKLRDGSDESLQPLIGATFTIYDYNNEEVGIIKSDENGYATKYNTDSIYGLPEGIYTIRETEAPRGFIKDNNRYTFIVRKEDDNKIITVGKLNGTGDDTAMIFENKNNVAVEGGGLIIKIVDENDNLIPTGATFEIVDEDGNIIDIVTTNGTGSFKTGIKDLELNKRYYARLKNGPKGYISTIEIKSDKLTENEKYKTLIFPFIKKTCTINIDAEKVYNKKLNGNDFKFNMYDINDEVVATAYNNADGKIKFTLKYDADNLGYIVYKIKEENSGNSNIEYDDHEEEIVVFVEDDGTNTLSCSYESINDTITFENKFIEEEPKEEEKPIVPEEPKDPPVIEDPKEIEESEIIIEPEIMESEEVPKTFDGVIYYYALIFISLLMITIIINYYIIDKIKIKVLII